MKIKFALLVNKSDMKIQHILINPINVSYEILSNKYITLSKINKNTKQILVSEMENPIFDKHELIYDVKKNRIKSLEVEKWFIENIINKNKYEKI